MTIVVRFVSIHVAGKPRHGIELNPDVVRAHLALGENLVGNGLQH